MAMLKKQWLLFLLPLLVPLLVMGFHTLQTNKTLYVDGSGFKTDAIGERSSLSTLSYYLGKEPTPNTINIRYFVSRQTGSHRGTSIYSLEYSRREKTLKKSALVPPFQLVEDPPHVWLWSNVEEGAIHRVAAPVRAMRFIQQIEAYKGGNLPELAQSGATLTRVPN